MDMKNSLFKIADALQIPLDYADGKVTGQRGATFSPVAGLSLPLDFTVSKLFSGESCGVVAHVLGDLYIVVGHFPKTGAVSAFLIDGSKVVEEGVKIDPCLRITSTMGLKEVIQSLKKSVVASFVHKDRKWSTLKLPA